LKKKFLAILLSILFILPLTGCSVMGLDTRALLSPPKANADQQEIHKLLQGDDTDFNFIYPRNGDYRSAVIMQDFTGDGVQDAVGFYELEEGGIEVQFIIHRKTGWETAAKYKNSAVQVDRVCFGDLNGDGITDVLIGWGNTQSGAASLHAYSYSYNDDRITEYALKNSYNGMTLTDFDDDGVKEIFILQPSTPEQEDAEGTPARAAVFSMQNGELVQVHMAEADNSIVRYPSISFGKVSETKNAVIVDGAKADSSMTTQIFHINENGLFLNSPAGVNTESPSTDFHRVTSSFLSQDINGDGILEIPVISWLPTYPNATDKPDSTAYLVSWSTFDEKKGYQVKMNTLMNLAESYYFEFPSTLNGRITAINDTNSRTVSYFPVEYDDDEAHTARMLSQIFSIRVFTASSWEQRGEPSGYTKLAEQGDYVYGISISTTEKKYENALKKIQDSFQLISG